MIRPVNSESTSTETLAVHLGPLGVDFTVAGPAELVEPVYHRRPQSPRHQPHPQGLRTRDVLTAEVGLAGDRPARKRSRSSSRRWSSSPAGVSSSRRARRSATVGTFSTVIRCPVTRSMVCSIRCSRARPG